MRWRTYLPVVVIALTALAPTWKFLFGGLVPAPIAQIHQMPPWNEAQPEAAWEVLQLDAALQFLPWRDYMLDALQNGHVPLWNPYSLGGTPFLANSQSAPLYPLHLIWPFDAESLLSFSAWLHLFIAGLGIYLLCRRLGATELGGVFAAVAFQLSAFMIGWLELPSVGMTAAWIPWSLLGVLRVHENASGRNIAKLAVCVGLMLLAGHLQIAAFGLMACLLYLLWLAVFGLQDGGTRGAKIRGLAAGLAGVVLGGMLASPQVVPSYENGQNGHRLTAASAEGWAAYKSSSLGLQHSLLYLLPMAYGLPGSYADKENEIFSFWLKYQEPGREYPEVALWAGPVTPLLALLGLWSRRARRGVLFFGVMALFGFAVAFGTELARFLYFQAPGWAATGSPGRAAILLTLALCVLCGLAIDGGPKLLSKKERMLRADEHRSTSGVIMASVCLTILFMLAGSLALSYIKEFTDSSREFPWQTAIDNSLRASRSYYLILGLGMAMSLFLFFSGRKLRFLAIGIVALMYVPVVFAGNEGAPRDDFSRSFPGLEQLKNKTLAVVNRDWSFYGKEKYTVAPPNSLLPYRIFEIAGYDSIIPKATKDSLDDINGRDSAPAANGNMLFVKPWFDARKLRARGADYVMSGVKLPFERIYAGEDWSLYRLPGSPLPQMTRSARFNERELAWMPQDRPKTKAWLHSSDADGWSLREITFSLKKGTATAVYYPDSYRLGTLLGLVGIFLSVALYCMRASKEVADEPANPA